MIESRVLKDVYGIDPEKIPDSNIHSKLEQTLYEILRAELEEKNEQILALQAELAEERRHSREQANKIAVFTDQAQKLPLAQMQTQITEDSGEDGARRSIQTLESYSKKYGIPKHTA